MFYIKCRRYKAAVRLQTELKSSSKRGESIVNCGYPQTTVFVFYKMFKRRMAFSKAIHSLYNCYLVFNATIVVWDAARIQRATCIGGNPDKLLLNTHSTAPTRAYGQNSDNIHSPVTYFLWVAAQNCWIRIIINTLQDILFIVQYFGDLKRCPRFAGTFTEVFC